MLTRNESVSMLRPGDGAEPASLLILVVDDDPLMRQTFRKWLQDADWRVEEARGGEEALKAFQRFQPDLVILDLVMPEMDGFETCAALRSLPGGQYTPILVVMDVYEAASLDRAFEAGATDFISRPVGSKLLTYRVRYLLRTGRAFEEQARSETHLKLLRAAVESLPIGITLSDASGKIIYTNPAEAEMHGFEVGELLHREARILAPPYLYRNSPPETLEECGVWRRESVNRRRSGEEFQVQLSSVSVRSPDGKFLGMVTACEDIGERKKNETRIHHLAYYDSLTGLPNRSLFLDRLRKSLSQAERSQQKIAVLFLDLDNFKDINDTEGHAFGDQLLKEVGKRLACCIREADTIARLGGDEFVVMLVAEANTVSITANRILGGFRTPFKIEGKEIYTSFSIGVALYPDDAQDIEGLLRSADIAMYKAKAEGRQSFQFFSPEMNREILEKVALEAALRTALDREEFTLRYRPHWDMKTGSRYVVEVLARWLHPEIGEIPPERFMPLAESSGLIFRLGEWILRSACSQAKTWIEVGCPVERVAIKISSHQLCQRDFPDLIEHILAETKLDPSALELEFAESIFINNWRKVASGIRALKAKGIHLSIDNFGIGYSFLEYLKHSPVDRIKIDRSVVAGIQSNPGDAAMVASVIALARALKIGVLAEGVETLAQLEFLQLHGCGEALGFLLAMPMSAENLRRWLEHPPVPLNAVSGSRNGKS